MNNTLRPSLVCLHLYTAMISFSRLDGALPSESISVEAYPITFTLFRGPLNHCARIDGTALKVSGF